ncbi:MAG: polysaccharide deacetylase family protein [Planctomycetes bacterium]|nr:polysaccharide deacetylase family protein [Planctomycetota bacterium]
MQELRVTVSPWPGGKRWVYSITFDEALSDLHRFAIPILDEFRVPGHLEVVVGQMGQVRKIGASSYNGFKHMGPDELREMLARGWGVGNHSWSHEATNAQTADLELGRAKEVLEEAIGEPITIYCSSGDNSNMNDGALAACRRFGYLGAMSLTDALNRPEDADLLWINRTFLHTQGYAPFYSEFDPFRNIPHARRDRGWIIDYLHCPLEQPVHPNKDCSAAQLRERIETVRAEGGEDLWAARVEEAVDYRYTRRAAKIEAVPGRAGEFTVAVPGLHPAVRKRTVTLELPEGTRAADVDGRRVEIVKRGPLLLIDVDLSRPRTLRISGDQGVAQ